MKYGLYLPNFGAFGDARALANFAMDAERAGWDGFFIWDHINRPFPTPVVDPWVALAAMAMNTSTLRIGAMVTPLARRRPWKLARETVSVDRLSGGRLIVGVGLGSFGGADVEWGHFGEEMDLAIRGEMLDEGLKILAGLWSGEPFAYNGKYYQVKESRFLPIPAQSPRIPVWVAGHWPNKAPFRRAARWDGVFPLLRSAHSDELTQLKEAVDYTRGQRSTDEPFEVVYGTAPTLERSSSQVERVAAFAGAGATWWLEQIYPQHFGGIWEGDWPIEAMRDYVLQGPPK
jgi:alkanesulfonate monooxygenase SsuD/methylene tetrahydromethanopterin reductase-like flavin-dependent oxidoreductase (luciferase family)